MDLTKKMKLVGNLKLEDIQSDDLVPYTSELLLDLGDLYSKMEMEGNNGSEFTKHWKKVRKLLKYSKGSIKSILKTK